MGYKCRYNHQKLDGKGIVKYMLPEIINGCFKNLGRDEKVRRNYIYVQISSVKQKYKYYWGNLLAE